MNYGILRGFLKPNSFGFFPKNKEPVGIKFQLVFYLEDFKEKKYKPQIVPCRIFTKNRMEDFVKNDFKAGDEIRIVYNLRTGFINGNSFIYLSVLEALPTGFNIKEAKSAIQDINAERSTTWGHDGIDNIDNIDDIF